jgi:hypothetical protein
MVSLSSAVGNAYLEELCVFAALNIMIVLWAPEVTTLTRSYVKVHLRCERLKKFLCKYFPTEDECLKYKMAELTQSLTDNNAVSFLEYT